MTSLPPPDVRRDARRRRRRAVDVWLRRLGAGAVVFALGLAGLMLTAIIVASLPALTQTTVRVDFEIDPTLVSATDPAAGDFRAIVARGAAALFPDAPPAEASAAQRILTPAATRILRQEVLRNPDLIGRRLALAVPAAGPYDQLARDHVDRQAPETRRQLDDADIARFDRLTADGRVARSLNFGLLFNGDSRFPEVAGLAGAITGSAMALAICLAICLPIGIATAILMVEFAPRNRLTVVIEANVNNLAAVPPILYGLLGLAVFITCFGLPRSSPLVAGMVLALMTLPTVVIATSLALRRVPMAIREAGFAVGASRYQVVLHHVLPLALPGILTGAIAAISQALGEAAPLLLIGMNAFVTSVPHGVTEAATTLPTQILLWSESPQPGFVARAAAAILVLLASLVALNGIAVLLRHRAERRR
ncbi:phosphate transport system permease protein [Amaricoccus macauensis]|uniref:Phosphate transport system permease protein n=1 Tax=Amaricoccus macauensis TaxID=57001 RepID=A0A840SMB9_9RHOB|nr:PstA family ABC transporter permease [Amaricoccus macauensis]MBB5220492.1 phosphate transport system permease protein [Amaricoccus macauensis]